MVSATDPETLTLSLCLSRGGLYLVACIRWCCIQHFASFREAHLTKIDAHSRQACVGLTALRCVRGRWLAVWEIGWLAGWLVGWLVSHTPLGSRVHGTDGGALDDAVTGGRDHLCSPPTAAAAADDDDDDVFSSADAAAEAGRGDAKLHMSVTRISC